MTSFIREAIEKIESMAQEAVRTGEFISMPGDLSGQQYWHKPNGELEPYMPCPARVSHQFRTPMDLRIFIASRKEADDGIGIGDDPAVFVDTDRITFAWDRTDGRDLAIVPLSFAPQFSLVSSLGTKPQTQKQMIRLLRVELDGVVDKGPQLLAGVRSLNFASAEETGATVNHGDESIGRSIKKSVTNADKIPESIVISIPVLDQVPTVSPIRCIVEIDLEAQKINVVPIPEDIKKATDAAVNELIRDMTLDNGPPVYGGQLRSSR